MGMLICLGVREEGLVKIVKQRGLGFLRVKVEWVVRIASRMGLGFLGDEGGMVGQDFVCFVKINIMKNTCQTL